MKICIVTTYLGQWEGGATISTQYLVDGLKNVSVDRTESNELFSNEISVIRTNQNPPCRGVLTIPLFDWLPTNVKAVILHMSVFDSWVASKFKRQFKSLRPDIVHLQDIAILPGVLRAATALNIPLIITVRDFRFICNLPNVNQNAPITHYISTSSYKQHLREYAGNRIFAYLLYPLIHNRPRVLQNALSRCRAIVTASAFVQRELLKAGYAKSKLHIVPLIAPSWSPMVKKNHATLRLLFAGRILRQKGVLELFQAVKRLCVDLKNPIHLDVIGTGPDLLLLQTIVVKHKLPVTFHGHVPYDKLENYYHNADIAVFPSIIPETFGRIALEGMMTATPVIASTVGAIPEVLPLTAGILIEAGNVDQLVTAIKKLHNAAVRKRMGSAGQKYAKENFSSERCTALLLQVYNDIVGHQ